MSDKIIFEWEVPEDHQNFTGYDDLPNAYRVTENSRAVGGCIIEARYGVEWIVNPWSTRPLIKHLISLIGRKDEKTNH